MGAIQGTEPIINNVQFSGVLRNAAADRLSELLHRALTSTGASGAALALVEGDGLVTRASVGQSAPAAGSRMRLAGSFTGLCVQTGAMLRCDDTEADQRVNAAACRTLNVRSIALIPVIDGGRVCGVFAVFAQRPGAFSIDHVGVLKTIGMLLGEAFRRESEPRQARAPWQAAAATPSPKPSPGSEAQRSAPARQPDSLVAEEAPARAAVVSSTLPQAQPAVQARAAMPEKPLSPTILRFLRSERLLHWSIAVPFMVCFVTALVLVIVYNPHPQRPLRLLFSWIHRISGICLALLPPLVLLWHCKEYRTHLRNIKEGWSWRLDDFKWLLLMGPAALSSRISLPDQGKFNAAEKLNFMMVMSAYPLFTATGVFLFLPGIHFLPWIAHVAMALAAAPLMLGHIFMATVNPGTRVGLEGMFSGYVDRHWAKHHYTRWYYENFEDHPEQNYRRLSSGKTVQCPACRQASKRPPLRFAVLDLQPIICPTCGAAR